VTVLLPVHDEAEGLPMLAVAMQALDYPREKLDIKLLLEASDQATIAEARRLGLEDIFDCLVVPDCAPKTKPKACHWGLQFAKGALTVIYDAEDAPESDQLRKAAAAFASAGPDLACAQAKLNFYNKDECLLSRLFALEYALWFDLMLPALERLRLPVPLGGTSNIFRTDILRACGGWDPHNVTEDADLGLRLARLGYRTTILDSTTYEEANCKLSNWLRQRSRWMKGYMQTWIVHSRGGRVLPRFRRHGGLVLNLFVGGNVFGALITPVLAVLWLGLSAGGGAGSVPGFVSALNAGLLLAGNLACVALAAIAPARRGWGGLAPFAILAPAYGLMASLGACKALVQLLTRPFYWEKTNHVVSRVAQQRRAEVCSAGRVARLRANP
jgi:cellulose synthase/poly-beta-1,6-N-acetylglucosamine synthase-like glycosyltransferase